MALVGELTFTTRMGFSLLFTAELQLHLEITSECVVYGDSAGTAGGWDSPLFKSTTGRGFIAITPHSVVFIALSDAVTFMACK